MTKKTLIIIVATYLSLAPIVPWGNYEVFKYSSLIIGYLLATFLWTDQVSTFKLNRFSLVLISLGIMLVQTFVYLSIMWFFIH